MIIHEQYFPVVLFIMLYKVVLTFEPVDEILKENVTSRMKAIELCLPVVVVIMPDMIFELWKKSKVLDRSMKATEQILPEWFSSQH